jgi:hypothetical protein
MSPRFSPDLQCFCLNVRKSQPIRLRSKARNLPFDKPFDKFKAVSVSNGSSAPSKAGGLSLPAGRQGLILHFDRLSVLSLPKEAAFFTPI